MSTAFHRPWKPQAMHRDGNGVRDKATPLRSIRVLMRVQTFLFAAAGSRLPQCWLQPRLQGQPGSRPVSQWCRMILRQARQREKQQTGPGCQGIEHGLGLVCRSQPLGGRSTAFGVIFGIGHGYPSKARTEKVPPPPTISAQIEPGGGGGGGGSVNNEG